jgi:hypothetical protein
MAMLALALGALVLVASRRPEMSSL